MKSEEVEKCLRIFDNFLENNDEYEMYYHELDLSKIVYLASDINYSGNGVMDKMIKIYKKGEKKSILTFTYINLMNDDNNLFVKFHFENEEGKITNIEGLTYKLFNLIIKDILK